MPFPPPPAQAAHFRFTTTDDVTAQTFDVEDVISQRQRVVRGVASLPAGTGPSGDTMDLKITAGSDSITFSIADGDDTAVVPISPVTYFEEGEQVIPEIVDDGGVTLAAGQALVFGYDYG